MVQLTTELRYFWKPPKQILSNTQLIININNEISNILKSLDTKVNKQYNRLLSLKNFTVTDKDTIYTSKNLIQDIQIDLTGVHEWIDSLPDIVQSDWNTTDTTDMSYIWNKPDVPILESGLIPERYLPSYVDDIIEGYYYNNAFYKDSAHTQSITGETGKIYVDLNTDLTYRWSGSIYVEISRAIITGVKGGVETNYRTGNVNITASNIGLGNVVNLDLSKAIKGITRNGTTFTYTCLDGTTGTFDQQDNNTTYSAGTGLQLTNTAFSVKLGYTTSGNNRAVQADTNGNLYVTQKDDNTWTAWKGATESANGTAGYMPAPTKAQYLLFLRGDGTWVSLNNYSLPLAANGTRGGILIGYTQSGKNYPVLLSSEKAYVNVPWTDTTYTFTNKNATLAWSTTSTIATVGGVDIKVTMPANPNTWRGIQDNLTSSTNTTESLSAKQGYLLANGSARDDTKLPLTGGTISNGSSLATIGFSRTGTGSGAVGGIDENGLYFNHVNSDGSKSINMYLKAGDGLRVGGSLVWNSGNDGSGSGLDADLLDGAHASYFVGGKLYGSKELTTKQWYRILDVVKYPTSFLLTFGPNFNNNEPTAVTFLIQHSYNHVSIRLIGAAPVAGAISEVRAIFHDTFKMYIEFYYNLASNLKNTVRYTVIPLTEITRVNISLVDFTTGSGTASASCSTSTTYDAYFSLNASLLWNDTIGLAIKDRSGISSTGSDADAWIYHSKAGGRIVIYDSNYIHMYPKVTIGTNYITATVPSETLYVNGSVNIATTLSVTSGINCDSYVSCTNLNAIDDVTISKGSGAARLRVSNAGVLNANNVIEFSQDNAGNTKHFQIQDRMNGDNSRRYLSIWGQSFGSLISASCASSNSYCCVGIGAKNDLYWDTTAVLRVYGNAKATAWNTTSDIRMKDIIEDKLLNIEDIANSPLFTYKWKGSDFDNVIHVGTSALYWNDILPEVVTGDDSEENYLSLQYGTLGTVFGITIARKLLEQNKEISLLKEEIESLRKQILNKTYEEDSQD